MRFFDTKTLICIETRCFFKVFDTEKCDLVSKPLGFYVFSIQKGNLPEFAQILTKNRKISVK